jgi:hypothetical protein
LAFDAGAPANLSGVWVNVECGSPAVLLFEAGPVPVTDVPASGLRASLSAPASVSGGSTLAYMVILSNLTSGAIAFGSCPSYTESLGGAARTLELNCAQVGSLAPGQSAAFEMKIGVPRSIGPGSAKLSWQLEVPDGTAAGVVLQVS